MRFAVLGPLLVEVDGRRVELGARVQRRLLAALVVNVGRVVSVSALIDAVWGDTPPASAVRTVQSYVARLRDALVVDPAFYRQRRWEAIVTAAPGYRLVAPADAVDAVVFTERVQAARRAIARDNSVEADRLLADAFELWRGEPYGEFTDGALFAAEAQRLVETRLAGLEARLEVGLALGRHAEVVAEAQALCAENPLHEPFWVHLITALYRGGRQADALAALRRVRVVLAEEIGADPGLELSMLEQRVLRQDPTLAARQSTKMAASLSAVVEPPGRGLVRDDSPVFEGQDEFRHILRRHRTLAGLSQEALAGRAGISRRGLADLERGARRFPYPDTARRLAAALELDAAEREAFMAAAGRPGLGESKGRYTLQIEPSPLVGRERELEEISRLVVGSRLLTLTGTGGIGKTRLAVEMAHRAESKYAGGAVIVDLTSVIDGTVVPDAVAAALGVSVRPSESVTDCVRRHLQPRHVLLVLDNCEHLVAACAQLADVLIRANPNLQLVVTSREPLRIHGETVWVVPPLAADESVALFIRRAQAAAAVIPVTSEDVETVREICGRLEGIPLAIELAAVRVPALGVGQVADLLADRLDFLSHGSRLDSPRHHTLRAAIDWSYALLDPSEERLFVRLAVFSGGWTLHAARVVCAWGDVSPHAVLDGLVGLVDRSLVLAENVDGQRRYRFLETIREYALERLAATGDSAETRARHARYVQAIAEDASVTRLGIRYSGDMARVRVEHANLQTALRWLLDEGMLEQGLGLCQALSGFWLAQGLLREGQEWLGRYLARPDEVPPHQLAAGLYAWGRLAEYAGALDRAGELFEHSRSASVAHDDATILARALCGLGDVALHHARYSDALDLYREALDAAEAADSIDEIALALMSLGRAASLLGDIPQSSDWLERALTIQRRLGDRWGVAYVLNEFGQVARRAGRFEQAQALLEECHVLWRQAGTRMGERAAVMNLALVTLERGALVRSAELARDSLDLSRELGDDGSATTVRCIEIAAQVLRALDSTATALSLAAAATRRRAILGTPRPAAEQPEFDRILHGAREAVGESAFHAAWTRGETLPIHDAVDLAATRLQTFVERPG
jgi:predicted ATPase/DNA-binding SARP family transcriptional activator/DNA-binding XRE family transcriptional regulator